MISPLLKTKLYVPSVHANLVSRHRLLARLKERTKLTLLSAPAGFGKTTLLANWVRQINRPVAWLSLDSGDNDPVRFWLYVIAALQTIRPGTGQAGLALLQSPHPPSIESILTELINEIVDTDMDWVLVLDDLHAITEPKINHSLVFLLDHLPPQMHLILSTRADPPWPLARLRVRGEITELRTQDLLFTLDEASTFLNAMMGLDLSAQDIAMLDTRTEGWIAGLQLAALSMQGRDDTSSFVQAFSGSHRFVLDYLVEEVLDRQPRNIQEFLLKTSVLDRLSAPLCDAILIGSTCIDQNACDLPSATRQSSSNQAILERLEQANAFLIPLDDERHWYRYHHLFTELLRNRLKQAQPDQVPLLRGRASEWCECAELVDEAISYALAARDYERAADLILRYGSEKARRGAYLPLHHWLESLPEDIIRSRPRLCIWYGRTSTYHSLKVAEQWAETTECALTAGTKEVNRYGPFDPIWIELLNLRANIAYLRGDGPQAILDLVQQARKRLPEGQTLAYNLIMRLAESYRDLGEDEASDRGYVEAKQRAEAEEHYSIALHAVCGRVMIARRYGRLPQAVTFCRQALRTIAQPVERSGGRLPVAGLVHILLGRILLEWNELEQAQEALAKGLALSEPLWGHMFRSMGRVALARAMLAQGHMDELPELDDLTEQPWSAYTDYVAALRAWITWMRTSRVPGGLESVPEWTQIVRWAEGRPLRLAYQDIHIRPQFLQIRLLITQYREYGRPRLEPILNCVKEQFQFLQERGWIELMIDASIVQAMALQAQGKRCEALTALELALTLAKPGRWVRIFADEGAPMAELLKEVAVRGIEQEYANSLLIALDADRKVGQKTKAGSLYSVAKSPSILVEPLSERELEVLHLLPSDLSSTEIAEQLYISKNTVRSHIGHIYDKLDVHSREDAVQRAQELDLL